MARMESIVITHFSDVLCVWAYVSQSRVDKLRETMGEQVTVEARFCSVFGHARKKLQQGWQSRGGLSGYGAHVRDVVDGFDHVTAHPDVWRKVQPPSSLACHVFLCALRVLEEREALRSGAFVDACWALRKAYFCDLVDVSRRDAQLALAEELGLSRDVIEACLDDGTAHGELSFDLHLARDLDVKVSPTLVLDGGRQRLNGNVSTRVIEANVRELLEHTREQRGSVC